MKLHPDLQAMLDQLAGRPLMHELPLEMVRAGYQVRYAALPPTAVGSVEDRTIAGEGRDIRLRIYRPDETPDRPVVVFLHGGGFVMGNVETHDALCRRLCRESGSVVVSVDYALAPEWKFPAGLDDCLAAIGWGGANAGLIGGNPARLALAGDSAGANLAAVCALRLRDEGGPRIAAQLLIYPVTDHPTPAPVSYSERGSGFGLTADTMMWFWGHYLDAASAGAHPHVSPHRVADLSGLPPAYVLTAEFDPLRDEGIAFARRLADAGVETVHMHYEAANHGFISWVGAVDLADDAVAAAGHWLARKLA